MALVSIYDEDFSTAGSELGWKEVRESGSGSVSSLARVTDDGAPYIKAVSTEADPWWWDPNHYYPGLGYVNLLAIAYTAPNGNDGPLPLADYRGGKVVLEARVKDFILPREARMIWWFQNADGVRFYNYGQIANTIDEQLGFGSKGWGRRPLVRAVKDSGWRNVEIPLPANDAAWMCYGGSPIRDGVLPLGNPASSVLYACAPGGVAEAMTFPMIDMGVHLIWENTLAGIPRGSLPPSTRAYGELHLRRVRLFVDQ